MLPVEIVPVLAQYSRLIPLHSAISAASYHGYSGADVWKVVTASGSLALRRWPLGGLPFARLRGLHRLLEHVHRQGVDFVAVPITTDSGDTLVTSADDADCWQLEPWLPGVADYHVHPSKPKLRAALTALARWHHAAATFVPDRECRQWFGSPPEAPSPAVRERLRRLQEISPRELAGWKWRGSLMPAGEPRALCLELIQHLHQLHPRITEELRSIEPQEFTLQPCLRDIWHDHVLFTGGDVTGLIDASACRTEHVATDLARLIGSFVEDDSAGWQFAMDAYQQQRRLSLAEETLVRVLDRSGVVLGAVTWLDWLTSSDRQFPEPEQVLRRLRHFQRRLAAMQTRFVC